MGLLKISGPLSLCNETRMYSCIEIDYISLRGNSASCFLKLNRSQLSLVLKVLHVLAPSMKAKIHIYRMKKMSGNTLQILRKRLVLERLRIKDTS